MPKLLYLLLKQLLLQEMLMLKQILLSVKT